MSEEQVPPRERALAGSARIALIASSYAPAIGGVEQAVSRIAAGLVARGHEVEVWTVDRAGGSSVSVLDGVTVRYLPAPLPAKSAGAITRFLLATPRAWRQWSRSVRGFRPNLVHVHCFGPNGLYALAVHRRFRVPLFLTSHGETLADDGGAFTRSALLRWGLRRAVARAVAVTAPSRVVLDDLEHYGLRQGRVIPNGVELGVEVRPERARGGAYLFAVGRLGRMKGFDLLIEAFARADLDPRVQLVIAGDGPERERLEELTESLGVAARVDMVGWMPPQGVADTMAGALAVVVPSRMEAFGIVALEAWRSGAPLIMTMHGGAREFVREGSDGILVDPLDTPRFADALRSLVGDPSRRAALAEAGKLRVREFGWDAVVDRYEQLYADAPPPGGAR